MAEDDEALIQKFPMSAANMKRIVREIARDTSRIIVLAHALERAAKRGFSRRQIERCCQLGTIVEGDHLRANSAIGRRASTAMLPEKK